MSYISELEYYSNLEKYPNKKKQISKRYFEKTNGLTPSDLEDIENMDED